MATFPFYFLASSLFFLLLLPHSTTSTETCTWRFCGSSRFAPPIHFPFKLKGDNQSESCGYPGFDVFCSKNKSQTLLSFEEGGVYALKSISYDARKLWINDPDDCLPKRFLYQQIINFSGSPFELSDDLRLVNFTFFNCSNEDFQVFYPMEPIDCLSDSKSNTSVVAMASESETDPLSPNPIVNLSGCHVISSAWVPYNEFRSGLFLTDQLFDDIQLQWTGPICGYPDCEGSSNKRKYGLGLSLGIPAGIMWFIMVSYLVTTLTKRTSRERVETGSIESNNNHHHQQPSIAAPAVVIGEANIERYSKTKVEDDGKLPNPNDTVCSICLCEYQPKEILRTIPDCNHYFHAHCLEGWLKINASCPLCRNLPKSSSCLTSSNMPQSSSSL